MGEYLAINYTAVRKAAAQVCCGKSGCENECVGNALIIVAAYVEHVAKPEGGAS